MNRYCHIPAGQPATLMTLVRVACLRWPVEEDFEFGKDHFGLETAPVEAGAAGIPGRAGVREPR